ncbi:MAG: hypothetical protein ABW212_20805, partial [Pseudonocardia sediminis]
MAHAPQPRRSKKAILGGAALALVAAPAVWLGVAGSASAAELTPVAEYLDQTVADEEASIGAALDALGLEAAE